MKKVLQVDLQFFHGRSMALLCLTELYMISLVSDMVGIQPDCPRVVLVVSCFPSNILLNAQRVASPP